LGNSNFANVLTAETSRGAGPLCACGCGGYVKWNKDKKCWGSFINGHQFRGKRHSEESREKMSKSLRELPRPETKYELAARMSLEPGPLCECGCGLRVRWNGHKKRWNRYLSGHIGRMNRGRSHTREARAKMRQVKLNKVRSEETKRKISIALSGRRGKKHTEATKRKMSEAKQGERRSEETKERIREARLGRKSSEATKEKQRKAMLKKWQDPKYAAKIIGGGRSAIKCGFREDVGHYVRSGWEANFARLLKFLKREYEYEPKRFVIETDGEVVTTYLPDFYLVDLDRYIEIKGWWYPGDLRKVELFQEAYPDIGLDIIERADYKRLKSKFSKLVPNWE